MKDFFIKFGIKINGQKASNNLIINILLIVIEIIYFGVSIYNLFCAENISGFTVTLNCLSFSSLITTNFRKEHEHLKNDDRYSLYFFMFGIEFLLGVVMALAFIVLGADIERFKTLLFMMLIVTMLNKLINIIINLYDGE